MVEDTNPDNSTEGIGIESSKRTKTQTKYPLPDGRTDFATHQLKIISAYATMSPNGSKELKYSDFSQTILGFNNQYVSGNNKFLESIGLISSCGGGRYKPTQEGINFQQSFKWETKIEDAKKILKKQLIVTWFWEATSALFELKNAISKEDLIEHLGHAADADPKKHNKSLRTIIDYLLYASLIKLDEVTGEIRLYDDNGNNGQPIIKEKPVIIEQPIGKEQTIIKKPPITKEAIKEETVEQEIVQEKITKPEISFKNQVNVNISIELKISPETSKDDIKGKIEALVEALNALK